MENSKDMAQEFNKFFTSVFTLEDKTDIPNPQLKLTDEGKWVTGIDIKNEDIEKRLRSLKVNKSGGPDGFNSKFLFMIKEDIVEPLREIFNESIREGVIPDDWKIANVTPIFKKGARDQCSNYRPVSLTSIVGKLLESIIRDKITTHLEANSLILDTQHGFTKGRSCVTNLLTFFDKVTRAVDEGGTIDVIYLDFQKAFDKVPHLRLVRKCEALGIRGQLREWIAEWLRDRKQRVGINGCYSDWADVISGVPQGSVLGPLLFLIYINDIDEGIKGMISKFADDTKIAGEINVHRDSVLQEDINTLCRWADTWQMKFNKEKCKVVRFGNSLLDSHYYMENECLKRVVEEKDLGVMVHSSLKGSRQCHEAVKKANRCLGMIARNIKFKSSDIILPLYRALVRPHLEYGVQFWNPTYKKDVDMIERVQRRATRMITGLRTCPYDERLRVTKLFSLKRRRLRGDLIQVFRIYKGIDKVNWGDMFVAGKSNRTRGHGERIYKERCRLDVRKHFFTNRVVDLWNSLPEDILRVGSVVSFKRLVDDWFDKRGIV
jgi:hypothetical protein